MAKKTRIGRKYRSRKAAATKSEIQPEETNPLPPPGIRGRELQRWCAFEQDKLFQVTKADFKTKRLVIYSYKIRMSSEQLPRTVFLGFDKLQEFPRLIVSATVWLRQPLIGNHLDWLEVFASHQRAGYATEFWRGLVKHLGGELSATPTTDSGKALVQSLKRKGKK